MAGLCEGGNEPPGSLKASNSIEEAKSAEVARNIFAVYGDIAIGESTARKWFSRFKENRHFTQLVWASTQHFGVGKARSRTGKVLVVAHYRPPGNISGLFQQNVLPPLPDYDAEMTSESGTLLQVEATSYASPLPTRLSKTGIKPRVQEYHYIHWRFAKMSIPE
ncbi:hypothetical protein ANN_17644 [Periplaneta americana]|uniref:Mos1 transposase HTH domain-containing protein n=1 Tax=Periplaneta americana TaxID=6978 RepID=A0ABQ8STI4_PERAM|nr:hypothetical protein ANN_17644 [Periplaneta americana]